MPIAELRPDPQNPRRISKRALEGLKTAIAHFGLVQPIIWNKRTGNVVGGHQRLKALAAIGEKEALVMVVDIPPIEQRAMNLSLNNAAITGDFTEEAGPQLQELRDEMPDLFQELILDEIDINNPESDLKPGIDDLPPAGGKTRVKRGDIWTIGDHRLLCGDSTNITNVGAVMQKERASVVFTDPPYGVDYNAQSGKFQKIAGDEKKGDDLAAKLLIPAFKNAVRYARREAAFYIFHASSTREDFVYAMKAAGIQEKQYLIWAKPQIALGWGDYKWAHEPFFYAGLAGQTVPWYGDRAQGTVWRIATSKKSELAATIEPGIAIQDGGGGVLYVTTKAPKTKKHRTLRILPGVPAILAGSANDTDLWEVGRDHGAEHPTQKPVELARRAIANSSKPGEIVFDPFLGSGTTLMGAEVTGRRCFGLELDPKYCDVIIRRWESYTGKSAKRC